MLYRDLWGPSKRQQLVESLNAAVFDAQYSAVDPQSWNRMSFRPRNVVASYLAWPKLPDLAQLEPLNGLMEKRGGALIDIDQVSLSARMQVYFDPSTDWVSLSRLKHPLVRDAARFDAKEARSRGLTLTSFDQSRIVRYLVRPFDVRHAYFTEVRPIWNEPRPELWAQYGGGNEFIVSRPTGVAAPEGPPALFTRCLGDNDAQRGHSYYLPFRRHDPAQGMLPGATGANLSSHALAWLRKLGVARPDEDTGTGALPWLHALAVMYAPQYLSDNADGITVDWPRIPVPGDREVLEASVALGTKVAALLDTEREVPAVTSGAVADHLRVLGAISSTDLRVRAGWGSRDSKGRVNPGRGRTEIRQWTEAEKEALRKGLASEGIDEARGFALLGRAVDVYLNETAFWRGVPEAAWSYVIGGYLVIKKWLSYREEDILGRPLTKDEAREVTGMVRRLTALTLLSDRLDANYIACRDSAYPWPSS